MTTAYRDVKLACPACATLLESALAGEATIDVCPACRGIWVDWFDGDLADIVKGAEPGRPSVGAALGGDSSCPRCQKPLSRELYADTRARVLRCGDCAGAFVPHASVVVLVSTPEGQAYEKGALEALLDKIQGWMGMGE